MGSGGKSGAKVEISEYTMSMHIGICAHTEGLELLQVKYGEKEIWSGNAVNPDTFAVNDPELFGGEKKEGGVKGLLWWLPGRLDQVMPQALAQRLGLTSETCPGFRGLASIFLTGTLDVSAAMGGGSFWQNIINRLTGHPSKNKAGFYVAANNPYLRTISVRARRAPIGLDPAKAMIQMPNSPVTGRAQYAANGAHIVYECLTNADWGMGESPGTIDKDSFEKAASTLYYEGFGLNMKWSRQTEVGKFIGEVLNHIYGALYVDPTTGKHTLKLLRADYDVESLPVIDASNANLTSFKRKAWGEIANEVVVTMTNSDTGKNETVSAQDLAGIAAQGGVTSTSKSYYGVTSRDLAARLAERDLAMSVNPIATCEAEVSRDFWKTAVNGLVVLSWPEYNIERIVFRVSEVHKGQNSLKLTLYEDIFGLDYADYVDGGGTSWQNPSKPPEPVSYYQVGTAPAFMAAAILGKSDASELEYPESVTNLIVGADGDDDVSYDVLTYVADINGTISRKNIGTRVYRGNFVITAPMLAAAQTLLAKLPGLRGSEPDVGHLVMFGSGLDEHTEICTVQSITEDGFLLNRGVLDTVPRDWPAGTRAFVIPSVNVAADPTERSAFENASYWLISRTTLGTLPEALAPRINVALSERAYLPNRPANVKVNGVGFGTVNATGLATIPVTWSNRNRAVESLQVFKWTEGDIAGEEGQTTSIFIRDANGAVLAQYDNLIGTSYTLPVSNLGQNSAISISVYAKRNGKLSLQGYTLPVNITPTPRLALQGDQSGALKLSGRTGFLQLQGDQTNG